jgi:hypothetical protein
MSAVLESDKSNDGLSLSLQSQQGYQIDPDVVAREWNARYLKWNHIWGDKPSPSAGILLDKLDDTAHILEVGFGYGRDALAFCQAGHSVSGLELSSAGLTEACRQMSNYIHNGRSHLTIGEFTSHKLPIGSFDAVFSHRTLHLMGNNGLVDAFARKAAKVVKANGVLVISARDTRDFDASQMIARSDGMIQYKQDVPDRQGQLISLWDEARFQGTFGDKFNILSLVQSEEIEAVNNPNKVAKFTVMTAIRKPL